VKIHFKVGDLIQTIEGDESELTRVLTHMGLIKSRSLDPMIDTEREAFRDLVDEKSKLIDDLRDTLANTRRGNSDLSSALGKAIEARDTAKRELDETRSALRHAAARQGAAERVLINLGWEDRLIDGRWGWIKKPLVRGGYPRPSAKMIDHYASLRMVRDAAVRTLEKFGFTYTPGAELWKPPLGERPYFAKEDNVKTYDSSSWTGR
jgi:hypothetical protein